MGKKKFNYHPR